MRLLAGMLTIGLVSMSSSSMAAKGIGNAVQVVQPEVQGALPGEPSERIHTNDEIERGLKVQLIGSAAYLQVAFNSGGDDCVLKGNRTHRFTGTARLQGASDVSFGDLANLSLFRIVLNLGKLWLAQQPETRCPVELDTPHARVPVKGTSLRMLVDPVVGTFVAVDEGVVTVQAKKGETLVGTPVEVTAGNWVLVPPGGLPTRPAPLPPGDDDIFLDPPLLGCCDGTEPPKLLAPQ